MHKLHFITIQNSEFWMLGGFWSEGIKGGWTLLLQEAILRTMNLMV